MSGRTRRLLIGGVIIGGALGYLIWTGTEQALVYFYTPSELQAQAAVRGSQRIRLGGMVVEGSLVHKPETLKYEFQLNIIWGVIMRAWSVRDGLTRDFLSGRSGSVLTKP